MENLKISTQMSNELVDDTWSQEACLKVKQDREMEHKLVKMWKYATKKTYEKVTT